ncbi:MAG: AbrB/MazE/SpoVT family DNA-binding domain-containing protein [Planctomycetaceae bacterium]|nr:AbrB/MazE/SpoVT family DNA-binding domain-containing protein [Planctomycetaceae bacterium]
MNDKLRTTLRVAAGGRIVIPAHVRHRLGLDIGSDLVLTVEDNHATLASAKAARHRARQRVRRYVGAGASLSEELMAERKKEAARD